MIGQDCISWLDGLQQCADWGSVVGLSGWVSWILTVCLKCGEMFIAYDILKV